MEAIVYWEDFRTRVLFKKNKVKSTKYGYINVFSKWFVCFLVRSSLGTYEGS